MSFEMLSVTVPRFSDPSSYQLSTVDRPTISNPNDVLIRVHAASVNPVDVKKAAGIFKRGIKEEYWLYTVYHDNKKPYLICSSRFPYMIGYDCAGVVVETGEAVKSLRVGDEVYTRLPESHRGSWSEYAKCPKHYVALKPKDISFVDAASLPLAAVTALQVLGKYKGSLSGKTVFIPAGLSGTGAYACQLAKNVFQAGKVITTVSASKVDKLPELLGRDVVDQVIDYTKHDPRDVIPHRSVDFLFDTTGQAMTFLSLMKPSTSLVVSISTAPSGSQLQQASVMKRPDNPRLPWLGRAILDIVDMYRKARARRWGVEYCYWFLDPNAEDLTSVANHVNEQKLIPVVGSVIDFRDIEKIKEACQLVYKGKGGAVGKTVIKVV